jgi:hypothetical protein
VDARNTAYVFQPAGIYLEGSSTSHPRSNGSPNILPSQRRSFRNADSRYNQNTQFITDKPATTHRPMVNTGPGWLCMLDWKVRSHMDWESSRETCRCRNSSCCRETSGAGDGNSLAFAVAGECCRLLNRRAVPSTKPKHHDNSRRAGDQLVVCNDPPNVPGVTLLPGNNGLGGWRINLRV